MKARDIVIGKQYRYALDKTRTCLVTILGMARSSSGYAMRNVRLDTDLVIVPDRTSYMAGTERVVSVKNLSEVASEGVKK